MPIASNKAFSLQAVTFRSQCLRIVITGDEPPMSRSGWDPSPASSIWSVFAEGNLNETIRGTAHGTASATSMNVSGNGHVFLGERPVQLKETSSG